MILSPAFDGRFYDDKPPTNLIDEAACAVDHFHAILHVFSERFFILLDGNPVAHSYVFNRMLGEFTAAIVGFANAYHKVHPEGLNDGSGEYAVTYQVFRGRVEGILLESHPNVFPYYSRCVDQNHKHFVWTGGKVEIFPRSKSGDFIILQSIGEQPDLPSHGIYSSPEEPPTPTVIPLAGKRRDQEDGADNADEPRKKRRS